MAYNSISIDSFTEEELGKYYIDYEDVFVGTLREFDERRYNLGTISSTDQFDTYEEAVESLIGYRLKELNESKSKYNKAIKLKNIKQNGKN